MIRHVLALFLLLSVTPANAETMPWSKGGKFEPASPTTNNMVGALVLSVGADGKLASIEFPSGTIATVQSLGIVKGEWDFGGDPIFAEVVEITGDPGKMLNGKALCGDAAPARFAVFSVQLWSDPDGNLSVDLFNSEQAPTGIYDDGQCLPLSYSLD